MSSRIVLFFGCISAAIAIAVAILFLNYRLPDYTIEFVIPNDFRGVIVLEHSIDGVEPVVVADNTYSFRVPPAGILRVSSGNLFENYHFTVARYYDGRRLPTSSYMGPNDQFDSEVCFRGLGTTIETDRIEREIFSVGSVTDFFEHRKKYGFSQ